MAKRNTVHKTNQMIKVNEIKKSSSSLFNNVTNAHIAIQIRQQ